jgi:hypothetical protein
MYLRLGDVTALLQTVTLDRLGVRAFGSRSLRILLPELLRRLPLPCLVRFALLEPNDPRLYLGSRTLCTETTRAAILA